MAGNHTRVNILVEGQTEETFVRELLAPHLTDFQVYLTPRIIETSKGHKGGLVSYGKIERQVRLWCKQDSAAKVTTLFDVYGLPSDFPGFANWDANQPPLPQVAALEVNLAAGVAQPNLIPYLQLHEYEALLFSDLTAFEYADVPQATINAWRAELAQCAGPEYMNNSPFTAPSKRIIARWPSYKSAKPHFGVLLALEIGLTTIRQKCLRFDQWVSTLEGL
ncbi:MULTISPECIES: DUF4276 family protein [unclassified Janthinobacterium]|uniref:DUF4276 family protein n=1 Tax=unclassified Janthinobacterium TaxID=2610881 RepID=UPI00034C4A66|nr:MULTISPECIES: DUF4276 family protein [unclassified Janthinobacterium]MEC5163459.1 hypothetical protein [Janthinobacterium sp. CG_S6]